MLCLQYLLKWLRNENTIATRLFYFANFLFLWTGIVQHLIAYKLDTTGLGIKPFNNLLAAAQPLGAMICTVWFRGVFSTLWNHPEYYRRYWYISVLDMGGAICTQASIALIGSGIFTVIYSVIVVFIATVGWFGYQKVISYARWAALFSITASVALSAFGQLSGLGGDNILHEMIGIAFAFGAVISYGLTYLMLNVEFGKESAPSAMVMCLAVSSAECGVNALYLVVAVLPNWNDWVQTPMADAEPDDQESNFFVAGMYALLIIVDGLHQIGFFYCVSFGKVAAVSSGVNKCLQAVGLFVFSHILFCNSGRHEEQCMNRFKIIGTAGVCVSVLAYSFDKDVARLFKSMRLTNLASSLMLQRVSSDYSALDLNEDGTGGHEIELRPSTDSA